MEFRAAVQVVMRPLPKCLELANADLHQMPWDPFNGLAMQAVTEVEEARAALWRQHGTARLTAWPPFWAAVWPQSGRARLRRDGKRRDPMSAKTAGQRPFLGIGPGQRLGPNGLMIPGSLVRVQPAPLV